MQIRFSWLILLLFMVSCREPELPDLSPDELVQRSATRMNELRGFHFIIERDGAAAYVDPDNILSFRRAEGEYVSPDRSQAVVRIIAPGLITDVAVISVAEVQWQTNVLTGEWEELPPNWGFNPAVLFDETVGLPAILQSDLLGTSLVGVEELEDGPNSLSPRRSGGRFYHISSQASGERLFEMSGGLIGPETVDIQLWIAPDSFELIRTTVTESASGDEEPSVWQVDFSEFDTAVTIEPPTNNQ